MMVCLNERTGEGCGALNEDDAQVCHECGMSLRFALKLVNPFVKERYRIIRGIGRGGYGAVYKAEDTHRSGLQVALKESFDLEEIRTFEREFNLLQDLRHPNLPRYYDMFESQDSGYLVMEFVPGQSLQNILDHHSGALPEVLVLSYMVQLCDVLMYLHNQSPPVTHRDIKPSNIRLTSEGLIKLVDFGLVKWGHPQDITVNPGGTRTYSAPEQWRRTGKTGTRSDIYSLGATLYHLLTGQPPTQTADRMMTPSRALPSPRSLNRNISRCVSNTIVKAMALKEENRYQSVLVLRNVLFCEQPPDVPILPTNAPLVIELDRRRDTADYCNLQWSSDGTMLVWNYHTGHCIFWDLQQDTTRYLSDKEYRTTSIFVVALSPDGTQFATVPYYETSIKLWDVSSGQFLGVLRGHEGAVVSIAYSPDGELLASVSQDMTVRLWRLSDGLCIHVLHGHTDEVWSVGFSPNGSLLVSGSRDTTVKIWQVSDGTLVHTLEGHEDAVTSVSFSPDGDHVVSGSADTMMRAWRATVGDMLHTIDGHESTVWKVGFSPDGQLVVSASQDGTIKLWRARNGKWLHTLYGHEGMVSSVSFSPDGKMIASGSNDGTVRLWGVW